MLSSWSCVFFYYPSATLKSRIVRDFHGVQDGIKAITATDQRKSTRFRADTRFLERTATALSESNTWKWRSSPLSGHDEDTVQEMHLDID